MVFFDLVEEHRGVATGGKKGREKERGRERREERNKGKEREKRKKAK